VHPAPSGPGSGGQPDTTLTDSEPHGPGPMYRTVTVPAPATRSPPTSVAGPGPRGGASERPIITNARIGGSAVDARSSSILVSRIHTLSDIEALKFFSEPPARPRPQLLGGPAGARAPAGRFGWPGPGLARPPGGLGGRTVSRVRFLCRILLCCNSTMSPRSCHPAADRQAFDH
jgi:hypothetical protein